MNSESKGATLLKWFRPVQAIAFSTYREVLRDRLLLNLAVVGVLLVLGSLLASQLALRSEGRVLVDLGVFAFSLTLGMVGVFFGSSLFAREIERRTFHMALSRPISRLQFVTGKYLGLALIMVLNAGILTAVLLGLLAMSGDGLNHALLGPTFFSALFLEFLQSLTLLGLAILFSSFSTTSLAVVMTLGCFLVGANLSQLRWLAIQPEVRDTVFEKLLTGFAGAFPNFELFDVDSWVSYGLTLPDRTVSYALAYALSLIGASLLGASLAIQGRENA